MSAILEERQAALPELSPRLAEMKRRIRAGEHHRYRSADTVDIHAECEREGLDWTRRAARLTRRMCEAQTVVIEPDERIAFTRTVERIPPLYRPEQMNELQAGRTFHELGPISNICADWGMVLGQGLLARRAAAEAARARLAGDREAETFLDAAVETIDAVLELARRYAAAAQGPGSGRLGRRAATGAGPSRRQLPRSAPGPAPVPCRSLAERALPLRARPAGPVSLVLSRGGPGRGPSGSGGSPGTAGGVLHQPKQGQRPLPRNPAGRQRPVADAGRDAPGRRRRGESPHRHGARGRPQSWR